MSIADFMFTPREQRVLSLVLSAPERTFNLAELMSRSGAGSGAGQHTVRRLWEAGVLRESRMGNQRLFQANTDFPLYPELRSICAKSFGLAGMLREALAPLVDEIDEAFVFGSEGHGYGGKRHRPDGRRPGESDPFARPPGSAGRFAWPFRACQPAPSG